MTDTPKTTDTPNMDNPIQDEANEIVNPEKSANAAKPRPAMSDEPPDHANTDSSLWSESNQQAEDDKPA